MEYPSYFDIPVQTLKRKVATDELDASMSLRKPNPKKVKKGCTFSMESITAIGEDEGTIAGRRYTRHKFDNYEWIPDFDPDEFLENLDGDTDDGGAIIWPKEGSSVQYPSDDSDTDVGGAPVDIPFENPTDVPLDPIVEDGVVNFLVDPVDDSAANSVVEFCAETLNKREVDSEDAKNAFDNGFGYASNDQPVCCNVSIDRKVPAPVAHIGTVGRSRILGNTIAYRRAIRPHAIRAPSTTEPDTAFQDSGLRKEARNVSLRQPVRYCVREENLEQVVEMIEFAGYPYQTHRSPIQDGSLDLVVWLPWTAGQTGNWDQVQHHLTWASQGGSFW
jgi:hypothetical protein